MSMLIRDIFADDINREIQGVITVNDDNKNYVSQEVREYVVTKELKGHFLSFFDTYTKAFAKPTTDIGVWITGFFGSGKSHFLKMLSYLLENREIDGKRTVEYFREKFADDPASFMAIDQAARYETETILFNIGVTASDGRPEASVRRAFAKKFYSHLGFCGESLKVTRLEQYIEKSGKTEEFRRVFEQKKGSPWLEQRKRMGFNGKFVVETLMEVLDMSEADAQSWFNDKSEDTIAIDQLVEDIRDYVRSKPKNFRLLFMVDEVGQYIGTDTDRLLDLQSLVEELGSVCGGSVWVVCTGQEAVDEIVKVRINEFSRIQARFKTRLTLSSSSVDEVIQKRLLRKKPADMAGLEALYTANDSVLRNLFSFRDCVQDIKGFSGPQQFAVDYPFVPYQFKLLQNVLGELRRHGSVGKNTSSGERSMLSSFQEAAMAVQEADEYTLVPFYLFYGTVHTVLDSSIRRAIERCDKAADDGNGIMKFDVDVLKLLYLIRYVDDIKATLENIVILMADDIRIDKVALREKVRDALDRLEKQNYINRTSDTYIFLTDEEQDIQREIQNTMVDNASVSERIGNLIFDEIYTERKFRYGKYDFPFDRMVDKVARGAQAGGLKLHFLTMASDAAEKDSTQLIMNSQGQAMVVLDDSSYYEALENALKIRKYVNHKNVREMPQSMQAIIRDRQKDATDLEDAAKKALGKAIQNAEYYVDGTHLTGKKSDSARTRIEQAMASLVEHVYSELSQIVEHANSDDDIRQVLLKGGKDTLQGIWPNQGAAAIVEDYLRMQESNMLSSSMADIQSRYQAVPYGWREIDIALVVARLVYEQKITIKQAGSTIQPDDRRLPDMLRKKSEIGKTAVALRQNVSIAALKKARKILGDYFDVMDVPRDEDGLVDFIVSHFEEQKGNLEELKRNYKGGMNYPGREDVEKAASLVNEVLSQRKDNVALMSAIAKLEDELFVSNKSLERVKNFFTNQKHIFDGAVQMLHKMQCEKDHLRQEQGIRNALDGIRQIVAGEGRFDYNRIPDLNKLMSEVSSGYGRLLDAKRKELLDNASQCMEAIRSAAGGNEKAQEIVSRAEKFYAEKEKEIKQEESLTRLDGQIMVLSREKDCFCLEIEKALLPEPEPDPKPGTDTESVSSGNGTEPKTPDPGQNRTGDDTEPEKPEVKP
ncbi:MAG: BREX system P-loop protein BrxC, partial [Desulfovibrionaceae bacterium]|nr:BREX system P-loop protein BrxC [Desulfovibrionaceae bacterium]